MRRLGLSAGAVLVALMLQLTLVDRLPLPAGGVPDLVLLVVVALGLTGGPVAGMLTGFCAGLALDIAPPASQLPGEHALVFCLAGYGCGRLGGMIGRSAVGSLAIAAIAVAGGEVLYVLVGLTLGDPGISWPAIRLVLPSSVLQDILVSPFVMYLVMQASSWAAVHPEGSAASAAASRPLAGQPAGGQAALGDAAAQPGRSRSMAGSAADRGPGRRPGSRRAASTGRDSAAVRAWLVPPPLRSRPVPLPRLRRTANGGRGSGRERASAVPRPPRRAWPALGPRCGRAGTGGRGSGLGRVWRAPRFPPGGWPAPPPHCGRIANAGRPSGPVRAWAVPPPRSRCAAGRRPARSASGWGRGGAGQAAVGTQSRAGCS